MEQPKNIDQLFRERLQGAEVPPPAFVWPKVEDALRKRRRRFLFWLWFGLGLTGAAGWALWPNTRTRSFESAMVTAAPKAEQKTITGVGGVATREEDYNRTGSATETTTPSGKPAITRASGRRSTNNKSGVSSSNVTARGTRSPAFEAVTVVPIPAAPNRPTSSISFAAPLEKQGAVTMAGLTFLPPATTPLPASTKPSLLVFPNAKPFIFKKKAAKNCYNFSQHPKVWLVDAYFGPSLPQRQLTATQPAYENYLGLRRNSEKFGWAFNAGVRGSLLFGQHFLLRTGLHYEQMTEVFEYADRKSRQIIITQITEIINNEPVTIEKRDTSYGIRYVKTFNRYGQLNVPLLAGVEFRNGRAGLSLQAGASLNVYFWKRGSVLNTQGKPQSFTPDASGTLPVFRQRAGWSTTASAQLFYHLRPRLRMFAEPHFSHNLRPLTLDGQPIAQRYTTWGLKLGITQIFD